MELDIISFNDLHHFNTASLSRLQSALGEKGIVGISNVPGFEDKSREYIHAARQFSALNTEIKQQYAPQRDKGDTEGYELGAERFKDQRGEWQIDDKKASYYAFVPDKTQNKWPIEVNLKAPYLELGNLIFNTGKLLMHSIGLNNTLGLPHEKLQGYGRLLHYHKESDATNANPYWCGAHVDHGVFTGLLPAYYFRHGTDVSEPDEAGLYIVPTNGTEFVKIGTQDKSILWFQVGEFAQLLTNDKVRATLHRVNKAQGEIERYTFALFISAGNDTRIHSTSILTRDLRYSTHQSPDGRMYYRDWERASFERYRAK